MCVCGGICREGGTPSSAAGRRRVPARRGTTISMISIKHMTDAMIVCTMSNCHGRVVWRVVGRFDVRQNVKDSEEDRRISNKGTEATTE